MKKLFYLAVLVCLPLFFTGCEKRVVNTDVTIYGTVFDKETFDPIQGAMVKLQPSARERITGSDGAFQFDNLDISVGKYYVQVSADNYKSDSKYVVLDAGESTNISFALEKK